MWCNLFQRLQDGFAEASATPKRRKCTPKDSVDLSLVQCMSAGNGACLVAEKPHDFATMSCDEALFFLDPWILVVSPTESKSNIEGR